MVDSVARAWRQLTRTSDKEGAPRWAGQESQATFVRDNNVFLVRLAGEGDLVVQLTDVEPAKPEPKLTESQTFLKGEEQKLIGHVREAAEKKKKRRRRRRRCRSWRASSRTGTAWPTVSSAPTPTTSSCWCAERQVYSVSIDGGPRGRLTGAAGANEAEVSPDEKTLALVHSEANQPPEVSGRHLPPHGRAGPGRRGGRSEVSRLRAARRPAAHRRAAHLPRHGGHQRPLPGWVRLVQRLIELRKEDWELAVYPVESHAFEEETSWADEYDRILKLFERKVRSQGRPAG